MCSNCDCKDKSPNTQLMLGENILPRKSAHMHLGTLISNTAIDFQQYMKDKINSCKKNLYAINAIGSRRAPVTPKSASHVYQSICLTKLLYGMEMMDIPRTTTIDMETFHACAAKHIQQLPDQCCNIAAVRSIGWSSIEACIDIVRLVFLWRLILLPVTSIYKKILIRRFVSHMMEGKHEGPLFLAIETARKYELLGLIERALETGESMPIAKWKRIVRICVKDREEQKWRVMSCLYPSIEMMTVGMPVLEILAWWQYVDKSPNNLYKCVSIVRLLMGCHRLNTCLYRYGQNEIASPLCNECSFYEEETVDHMLFRCSSLSHLRRDLWNKVMLMSPSEVLNREMCSMSWTKLSTFILSGLHNSFVPEWKEFFDAMCEFVYKLYTQRVKRIV